MYIKIGFMLMAAISAQSFVAVSVKGSYVVIDTE